MCLPTHRTKPNRTVPSASQTTSWSGPSANVNKRAGSYSCELSWAKHEPLDSVLQRLARHCLTFNWLILYSNLLTFAGALLRAVLLSAGIKLIQTLFNSVLPAASCAAALRSMRAFGSIAQAATKYSLVPGAYHKLAMHAMSLLRPLSAACDAINSWFNGSWT